jgi:hypothetical protein
MNGAMPSLPVLAVLGVLALWWFTRTRLLFRVSIRDGRALLVSGRISPGLLSEIGELVRRPHIARGSIGARAGESSVELSFRGLGEGQQQRMRNLLALYPVAQLRNAPLIARPSLGQLSSIAWLAWLFDRR